VLIKFTFDVAIGSGLGFVAGAFCPGVLRKIKSLFVKKASAAQAAVVAEVKKV